MTYFRDKLEKCDEKSNRRKKKWLVQILSLFCRNYFLRSLSRLFPESVEHARNREERNNFEKNYFEWENFEKKSRHM